MSKQNRKNIKQQRQQKEKYESQKITTGLAVVKSASYYFLDNLSI